MKHKRKTGDQNLMFYEDNYDNLPLERLESEYIRRKGYYRGEKNKETFIQKLREDDEKHSLRVGFYKTKKLNEL